MILPVGNGVTDGSLPFILFFVFMGFKGNEFWLDKFYENMTLADLFAYALTALQI